jgi:hypothetical protein
MCLKIRCDGESEKFCKIFWELNRALVEERGPGQRKRETNGEVAKQKKS